MSIETINSAELRAYRGPQAACTTSESANPYSPLFCVALLVAAIGLVIALG
jgi:hypothetical protein